MGKEVTGSFMNWRADWPAFVAAFALAPVARALGACPCGSSCGTAISVLPVPDPRAVIVAIYG